MSAPHTLHANGVRLAYDRRVIVDDLTIEPPSGAFTIIIGPNGCGKSTLLRALARLLTPAEGVVELSGRDINAMSAREVATVLGILPQHPIAPDGITVVDLVSRGRYPHQGWFRRWTDEDDEAVADALTATATLDLAARPVDELSGGQRQRVWIAMALAQRTDLLLLDEPTTYLDISHQVEVLDLLTDLNHQRSATIVAVLHDLNLACRYADHLVAMRDGHIVAEGRPVEVITPTSVQEIFAMRAQVVRDPVSDTPVVIPIGRHHCAPSTAPPPPANGITPTSEIP